MPTPHEAAHFEFTATVREITPGRVVLELDAGSELEFLIRPGDTVRMLSMPAYHQLSAAAADCCWAGGCGPALSAPSDSAGSPEKTATATPSEEKSHV